MDLTWLHESSKIIFNLDAVKTQILGTQKANILKLANVAMKIQGVLHEVCTVLKEFVKIKSGTLKQFENDLKDSIIVKHLFGNVTCSFSEETDKEEHEDHIVLSKGIKLLFWINGSIYLRFLSKHDEYFFQRNSVHGVGIKLKLLGADSGLTSYSVP